jgi:hypothetical protein
MLKSAGNWLAIAAYLIAAAMLFIPAAVFGQARRLTNKLRSMRTLSSKVLV